MGLTHDPDVTASSVGNAGLSRNNVQVPSHVIGAKCPSDGHSHFSDARLFMYPTTSTPPPLGLDQRDISALARRYRAFWMLLRVMFAPAMFMSAGFVIVVLLAALGEVAKQGLLKPFDAILPRVSPFLYVYLLVSWISWTRIGYYGRVLLTLALAVLTQGALLIALYRGARSNPLFQALSQGQPLDDDAVAKLFTLLLVVALPLACLAMAAAQAVRIFLTGRRTTKGDQGDAMFAAFRRIAGARRQTYRTFNFARLPFAGLALVGAAATFAGLSLAFSTIITHVYEVPPAATASREAFEAFAAAHPVPVLLRMLLEFALHLVIVAAMILWVRFAWRTIRRRATDVLKNESYRPVVFLRSFRDEDAGVAPKNPYWSLVTSRVRLEEVVAGQLAALGPSVAIGVPGERVPRLGAMRAYFADADWQAAIRKWTDRAVLSVVMAGTSPSVAWELDYLVKSGRAPEVLMVLPPDRTPAERLPRWDAACRVFAGTRWQAALAAVAPTNVLCVCFDPDGSVMTFDGGTRHQIDYEIAVATAVTRIFTRTAPASRAA